MNVISIPGIFVAFAFVLLLTPLGVRAQQSDIPIATVAEIKSEFDSVQCNNDYRLEAVKALFEKMGATSSEISIEKFKGVDNLVVRKPGKSEETIVIGAHYDKVKKGCGAVDNWTGIVTIAELYRSLKATPLSKTILFVAFGNEEPGLVGSRAMVRAIPQAQLPQYCEMINIDSLGMAIPQIADNMSNPKLAAFAMQVAKAMKLRFGHAIIQGGDADSSSFNARRIPAITIHGLTNDWPSVLHSEHDQASKIDASSVYFGYRLILALELRLDNLSCSAYR